MKKLMSTYRIIRKLFTLMVWVILVQSCNHTSLEQALDKAGANRQELEQVLEHYKDDELKLKAARFLIENMDAHSSLHHELYDSFYQDIDSLYQNHAGRGTIDNLTKRYQKNTIVSCSKLNGKAILNVFRQNT